jgi:hypothetical protein
LSASTMRPSTLAPAGATTQSSTVIGSSRIAENTSPVLIELVESSRVVLTVITRPAVKRATLGLGGAGGATGAGGAAATGAGCGAVGCAAPDGDACAAGALCAGSPCDGVSAVGGDAWGR